MVSTSADTLDVPLTTSTNTIPLRPKITSRSSSSFSKVVRKVKSLASMGNSTSRSVSPGPLTIPLPTSPLPSASPLNSPPQSISNFSIASANRRRSNTTTNSSIRGGSMFSSLFGGASSMARSQSSSSTSSFTSEFGILFDSSTRQRGMSLPVPPTPLISRTRAGSNSSMLSPGTPLESNTPPTSPHHKSHISFHDPPSKQPSNLSKIIRDSPPAPDESPADYVERLCLSYSINSLASILSVSGEPFFISALKIYLESFDFTFLALDIALRKFLLSTALPKETQQIDRVIESFSLRYHHQNPSLGISSDTLYVLSFSLIMLSTDLWNGSVKHKMSKAAYLKNCSVDSSVDVAFLEYLYDQTATSPFIFADDESTSDYITSVSSPVTPSLSQQKRNNSPPPSNLKLEVFSQIPLQNPFSFTGILPFFDASRLHAAYINAPILRFSESNAMRVMKIGQLSRKDDLNIYGEKSSSRKWRGYSVVLSGGQLLFFKSPAFAPSLQESINNATRSNYQSPILLDGSLAFKPDEAISLKNCIALYGGSEKYELVFRLFFLGGAECLLQASSEAELTSWITSINFAATFKSSNIRIRVPTITSPSTPSSSTLDLPSTNSATIPGFGSSFKPSSEYSSLSPSRLEALKIKIIEYESEITGLKQNLQRGLKRARSIAVCSPWKSSTRESLMSNIPSLAKQIRTTRTSLAKFVCYREVLSKELLVETREASAARRFTLFSESHDHYDVAESLTDDERCHLDDKSRQRPTIMSRSASDMGDMRFRSLPSSRKNSTLFMNSTSISYSTPSLLLP